jgi:hypothetical protein
MTRTIALLFAGVLCGCSDHRKYQPTTAEIAQASEKLLACEQEQPPVPNADKNLCVASAWVDKFDEFRFHHASALMHGGYFNRATSELKRRQEYLAEGLDLWLYTERATGSNRPLAVCPLEKTDLLDELGRLKEMVPQDRIIFALDIRIKQRPVILGFGKDGPSMTNEHTFRAWAESAFNLPPEKVYQLGRDWRDYPGSPEEGPPHDDFVP